MTSLERVHEGNENNAHVSPPKGTGAALTGAQHPAEPDRSTGRGRAWRGGGSGLRLLAVLGAASLIALHLTPVDAMFGVSPAGEPVPLLLGWIPPELGWRLIWILLAFVYLVFLMGCVWRTPRPEAAAGAQPSAERGHGQGPEA